MYGLALKHDFKMTRISKFAILQYIVRFNYLRIVNGNVVSYMFTTFQQIRAFFLYTNVDRGSICVVIFYYCYCIKLKM